MKKIFKFDDTEIKEYKFHQYKCPILISNIDINEIVVFNKFPFVKIDFKYSIGCNIYKKNRSLCKFF